MNTTEKPGRASPSSSYVRALIAHAMAYMPGDDEPDMASIRDTVLALAEDPRGKVLLDAELKTVNDPATVDLVRSLIKRVVTDVEHEAKTGSEQIAVVMQPGQAVLFALGASTVLAAAAGTLSLLFALPLGLVAFAGAAYATYVAGAPQRSMPT